MRYVFYSLAFLLVLLSAPLMVFCLFGLFQGLDVAQGLKSIARNLTGEELIYDVRQRYRSELMVAKQRRVIWMGDLENEQLNEASGLAAARQNQGIYFSINDSGNAPQLFAFHADGRHVRSWIVDYSESHDFEDLASFTYEGQQYVLIADTGDNLYWRPEVRLLVIPEPDLGGVGDDSLAPAWVIRFSYPDGQRDVESVAVDEAEERIYLISKRRVPPELFSLPLRPKGTLITAKYEGRLEQLPQPSARDLREDPNWGRYRSSPTALAMQGRTAIVATYRDSYLFSKGKGESWAEAFRGTPQRVALPDIYGLEAAAFDVDEKNLLLVNERKDGTGRAALYAVDL